MTTAQRPPPVDSPARAEATSTIYRLAAVAFGHPLPETQQAFADGSFNQALDSAWQAVTGRPWPCQPASASFAELESGYISTFHHGRQGRPQVALVAGEYDDLLDGQVRPAFLLNVQAFYKHFGLQAALGDEGRTEEPDHLSAMLEFMAVLTHLEAQALAQHKAPDAYRLAQRDFLKRHLVPLLAAIQREAASEKRLTLDATLIRLIEDLPEWARNQLVELETRVGVYDEKVKGAALKGRALDQNLWN
ncbi:molecular chaperone TorD family protein [Halomonas sp. PR-M31]|uniref:molecular chaperone TorD family protein n=1 Tax=Halomonas sp. PR-M31 TaxID=1471202 RepID=UPI0009E30703|nr:molecular chaperone TorD family protein [Halomonas sp. PR-M31]